MRKIYTEIHKEKVIKLHLEGKNDVEILKETGYGKAFIQSTTTKYWKQRMLLKYN